LDLSFDDITTGCVIRYPYLWKREQEAGETEGRKHRRTAVGLRVARANGDDGLILLAVTTTSPRTDQRVVEVPETEKHRAGLDRGIPIWIIVSEYNYDVVGQSAYLEPVAPLGRFSDAFFKAVMAEFRKTIGKRAAVRRDG
jgi:hypothetical protein